MSDKELKRSLKTIEELRIKFSKHTDPDLDKEGIFDRLWDVELRVQSCLEERRGPQ